MATKQELFDKVWIAMAKQGKPSTSGGICVYKDPRGNRCAAGHLMNDEELKFAHKFGDSGIYGGTSFSALRNMAKKDPYKKSLFSWINRESTVDFVLQLQQAHDHDSGADLKFWRQEYTNIMIEIARQHKLNQKVMKEHPMKGTVK